MLLMRNVPPSMINEFTSGGRPTGVAPIHLACNGKDHQPERCTIIHEMVRLSASPSLKVKGSGASPLHRAAGTGACDIVKVLLELGAFVNQTNGAGATPVDAARGSNTEANVNMVTMMVLMMLIIMVIICYGACDAAVGCGDGCGDSSRQW